MPGFFASNINSANQFDIKKHTENRMIHDCIFYKDLCIKEQVLDTFANDRVFVETENLIIATYGIIYNSNELISEVNANSLSEAMVKLSLKDELFFNKIDGSCSGLVFYKKSNKIVCFTSRLGDKAIFYYFNKENGEFVIGSQMYYVTDFLKETGRNRSEDFHGISNFLSFGYFIDSSTGVNEIKRLYPGDYMIISENNCYVETYYLADIDEKKSSIDEYINRLDNAFCSALRKIVKKNNEYGYKTIVDISGGLDTRVICYALKKLNLMEDAIAISYGQSDCYDQKIAQQIASQLEIDLYYKYLDTGSCLRDIDELILLNNGVSYYYGITGGKDFLKVLNNQVVGLEITGLLGDMKDSSMVVIDGDKAPNINLEQYRTTKAIPFDKKNVYCNEIGRFKRHELYWLYCRGMMAGMSTFFIRQNYVEPVTPFGDIEFLEAYLSIPWKERVEKKILLKWLAKEYPESVKIPYATTGISIMNADSMLNKTKRRILFYSRKIICRLLNKPLPYNMNPVDYWLANNKELSLYLDNYYSETIKSINMDDSVKEKVKLLYEKPIVFNDKGVALSILAYYKTYLT